MEEEKKCVFTTSGIHRPLGFVDFATPNEVPLSSLLPSPFKFKLGNGDVVRDPDEAALRFLQREYPEITERRENFPIFIPEFFLSEVPEVLNYDYAREDTKFKRKMDRKVKEAESEWEKKKKKDKDNYDMPGKITKIYGDQSEFTVFQQLQDILLNGTEEEYKNIVVIHGWKNKLIVKPPESVNEDKPAQSNKTKATPGKGVPEQSETDFLIICQQLRIIISIECKSKLSRPTCEKVLQQLKTTFNDLSQTLTFQSNWKFVKACSFSSIDQRKFYLCEHCKSFTSYPRKDLNTVWRSIFGQVEQVPEESYETSRDEFVEHVKRLAFLMHVNFPQGPVIKEIATKKLLENIDKASKQENIVLWTKFQHSIFYGNEKKVFLRSGFGTGKTLLLRSKALELAKSEQDKIGAAKKAKVLSEKSLAKGEKSKGIKSEGTVPADKQQCSTDLLPRAIYFLVFSALALEDAKQFFKGKKLIKVASWEDVNKEVEESSPCNDKKNRYGTLKHFLQMHADSPGIFIDEYSNRNFDDGADRTRKIVSEICSRFKTLWPKFLTILLTQPLAKEVLNKVCKALIYAFDKKPDAMTKIPILISKDPSLQKIISDVIHAIHRGDNFMDIFSKYISKIISLKEVFLSPVAVKEYIVNEVLDADIINKTFQLIHHVDFEAQLDELREDSELWREMLDEIIPLIVLGGPEREAETKRALAYLDSLAPLSENHLWIALNGDDRAFKFLIGTTSTGPVEKLRNFFCPHLGRNLRNVYGIVEESGESGSYALHTNPAKGRCPKVIKLVIRLPDEMAENLFQAFLEGYDHIKDQDGRVDDLAIVYSESFGPVFITLQDMIVDFLSSKNVPVHVVRAGSNGGGGSSSSESVFFLGGRKGAVLGEVGDVQGCEFKSVIVYFPVDRTGFRANHEGTSYGTTKNIILRAMCNLVVIDYRMASNHTFNNPGSIRPA